MYNKIKEQFGKMVKKASDNKKHMSVREESTQGSLLGFSRLLQMFVTTLDPESCRLIRRVQVDPESAGTLDPESARPAELFPPANLANASPTLALFFNLDSIGRHSFNKRLRVKLALTLRTFK